MEAVVGELVWCDVIPQLSRLGAFGYELLDEVPQVMLRASDVLASMQVGGKRGPMRDAYIVLNECVRLQHCFETFARIARLSI